MQLRPNRLYKEFHLRKNKKVRYILKLSIPKLPFLHYQKVTKICKISKDNKVTIGNKTSNSLYKLPGSSFHITFRLTLTAVAYK